MTTLLDLPIELEIKVLSELPARDIQRYRRVCKHLRDIIDEKSNANLLLQSAQAHSRAKISRKLAHVTDLAGVDFLEAFSRWLSRRAIWLVPESHQVINTAFCAHWAKQAMPESINATPEMEEVEFALQWFSDTLLTLHLDTWSDFSRHPTRVRPATIDEFMANALLGLPRSADEDMERLGITAQKLRQYGKEVLAKPDRLAASIVTQKSIPPDVMLSKRPLTTITSWLACRPNSDHDYVFQELRLNGLGDDKWLSTFLEIPEIPQTCNHLFAYCAGTDWTYRRLEEAEQGQALTELEKTAILEDIIFY
ncbi:hypothetical protein AC578_8679 [Pseudocercospora eumusae]|uniref:F-box domain-containing protein n=1 Tax=Pseudocercospora eumusae TaxID=321146 RepID=A0A139HQ69_9PEZI|nr:hypothetical protein AC578_8679 [Pseudocercospora eumusae]